MKEGQRKWRYIERQRQGEREGVMREREREHVNEGERGRQ